MEKITNIIKELEKEELQELKNLINKGKAEQVVNKELEKFKNPNKVCPVCNTPVKEKDFTLFFGPTGLRKKAIFDAADCLQYFLHKLQK